MAVWKGSIDWGSCPANKSLSNPLSALYLLLGVSNAICTDVTRILSAIPAKEKLVNMESSGLQFRGCKWPILLWRLDLSLK